MSSLAQDPWGWRSKSCSVSPSPHHDTWETLPFLVSIHIYPLAHGNWFSVFYIYFFTLQKESKDAFSRLLMPSMFIADSVSVLRVAALVSYFSAFPALQSFFWGLVLGFAEPGTPLCGVSGRGWGFAGSQFLLSLPSFLSLHLLEISHFWVLSH